MIRDETYRCSRCGGANLLRQEWVDMNTGETRPGETPSEPGNEIVCRSCGGIYITGDDPPCLVYMRHDDVMWCDNHERPFEECRIKAKRWR